MAQEVEASTPRRLANFARLIAAVSVAMCIALLLTATGAEAAVSSGDSGVATPTGAEAAVGRAGIQPLTTYNDSYEYDDQYWGGNSYHVYSTWACWQGGGVGINQLTSWNNRIRSYSIDSSCRENHYDLYNKGGINTGYQAGALPSMASGMDGKTSSMWFLGI